MLVVFVIRMNYQHYAQKIVNGECHTHKKRAAKAALIAGDRMGPVVTHPRRSVRRKVDEFTAKFKKQIKVIDLL